MSRCLKITSNQYKLLTVEVFKCLSHSLKQTCWTFSYFIFTIIRNNLAVVAQLLPVRFYYLLMRSHVKSIIVLNWQMLSQHKITSAGAGDYLRMLHFPICYDNKPLHGVDLGLKRYPHK